MDGVLARLEAGEYGLLFPCGGVECLAYGYDAVSCQCIGRRVVEGVAYAEGCLVTYDYGVVAQRCYSLPPRNGCYGKQQYYNMMFLQTHSS